MVYLVGMSGELSKRITEVAEEWLATNPDRLDVALGGVTLDYLALFDSKGNEIARWNVGPVVTTNGSITFTDIKLTVT